MISLSIPKNYKKGFSKFISLTFDKQQTIIRHFKEVQVGFRPKVLVDQLLADKSLGIQKDEVNHIVIALLSLFTAKDQSKSEVDTSQFIDLIVDALKELEDDDLEIRSSEELQLLFKQLFENDKAIALNNKAISLTISREKILTETRILTDVRPIFTEDGTLEISGSVVTHNLKIEYTSNFSKKEVYFALDLKDLKDLRDQITRALNKEQLLRDQLKKLSIPLINLTDEK